MINLVLSKRRKISQNGRKRFIEILSNNHLDHISKTVNLFDNQEFGGFSLFEIMQF